MRKLSFPSDDLGNETDPKLVQQFEEDMGFELPKRYKNFILKHSSASPLDDCFNFVNYYGKDDERDVFLYSFDPKGLECIFHSQINDRPDGSPYFVQFATCANGDHICFDYSKDPTSSEPAVVVVFHDDVYIDKSGQQKMVVNHVANSFGEFIDLLYEDRDPEIIIERIEIEV
jgi:cell wall assembly regulator SMI1